MMVCVGQAGNQIGASTARRTGPLSHLDLAAEALAEQEARTRRTKPSGFVFVDSEPKVVRTIVSEGSDSYLPFVSLNGSVVWDHNGRGNNWAWGYTGLASHRPGAAAAAAGGGAVKSPLGSERGQPLWQRALAAIHDQAEACDMGMSSPASSLLLVHSLGGGTGAGLGSRLLEACRDAFPKTTILSAVVAPFSSGDTPLQHYNMALTLATANEVADGVLLFDNDDLLSAARYRRRVVGASMAAYGLGGSGGSGGGGVGLGGSASAVAAARAALRAERSGRAVEGRGVGTRELNDVAAEALAGLLLPTLHRGRRMLRPGYGSVSAAAAAEGRGGGGDAGDGSAGGRRQRWVDVSKEPRGGLFGGNGDDGTEDEEDEEDEEGRREAGGGKGRDSSDEEEDGAEEGSAEGKRGRRGGGGTRRGARAAGGRPWGASAVAGTGEDKVQDEEEEEEGGSGRDSWIRASVRGTCAGFGGRPASSAGAAAAAAGAAGGSRVEAAMAALGRSDAADGFAGASAAAAAASSCVHYLDAAALVAELVPQPRLRYLDARSVSNMVAVPSAGGPSTTATSGGAAAAAGGPGALAVIPGLEWADLADRLTDVVPRYLARTGGGGGSRGGAGAAAGGEVDGPQRLVTTLAGRLYVRGARQLDCDSVDPTLPSPGAAGGSGRSGGGGGVSSSGSGGGGGSGSRATTLSGEYPVGSALRPRTSGGASGFGGSAGAAGVPGGIPGLWGGLPATEEWAVVSQKLLRGFNLAGRHGSGISGVSSGYGYGARPGTASAGPTVPLSALLTPHAGPLIGPGAALPAGARSLTSIVNSDIATPRLLACVERVEQLLRLRAYLHWYERFGVGADHMQAAAESVLDTVDAYAAAASAAASAGGGGRGGGGSGLSGVAGRRLEGVLPLWRG